MFKYLAGAALVGAITIHAPALAKKGDFELCDQLPAPKPEGNGMREPASSRFGPLPHFFQGGTAQASACSDALSDPLLLPGHDVRRAHLLRARAMALLDNGSADQALADIDAAQAAAKAQMSDPLFARTMGLSFDLIRAVAWQQKGDFTKARQLASDVGRARPYSSRLQSLVARILRDSTDATVTASPYALLLPLTPEMRDDQFIWLAEQGRFADALKLFPTLKLEYPKAPVTNQIAMMGLPSARTVAASTTTAMFAAYAYAATGDADRAKALIADTRTNVTSALTIAPDAQGVVARNELLDPMNSFIDKWAFITNARIDVAQGKAEDVIGSLVGKSMPNNALIVEFFVALQKGLPPAQQNLAPDPAALRDQITAKARKDGIKSNTIRPILPAIQTQKRIAEYKKSNKSVIDFMGPVGFRRDGFRSTEKADGVTTVEFLGNTATADTVDEMTILYAADLARQKGKAGFIIVARRDFTRTMNITRGYSHTPISSQPAGFQTQLDVRFVDPAHLPADLAIERDRVLDADTVYKALAPVYIDPPATT